MAAVGSVNFLVRGWRNEGVVSFFGGFDEYFNGDNSLLEKESNDEKVAGSEISADTSNPVPTMPNRVIWIVAYLETNIVARLKYYWSSLRDKFLLRKQIYSWHCVKWK
jgi:hypothetical protein